MLTRVNARRATRVFTDGVSMSWGDNQEKDMDELTAT